MAKMINTVWKAKSSSYWKHGRLLIQGSDGPNRYSIKCLDLNTYEPFFSRYVLLKYFERA